MKERKKEALRRPERTYHNDQSLNLSNKIGTYSIDYNAKSFLKMSPFWYKWIIDK